MRNRIRSTAGPLTSRLSLLLLLLLCPIGQVRGLDLLVPSQFPTIQEAIEAAQPGDRIEVAPGTYFENLDLLGRAVTLIGIAGPEATIVDGSLLTRGPGEGSTILAQSGEGPSTVIEGLTIRGGSGRSETILDALGNSTGVFEAGGGLLALGTSPTLRNCHFTANTAQFGGGLFADGGSGLLIEDCRFSLNSSLQGAGTHLRLQTGASVIRRSDFLENTSSTAAGGLMIEGAEVLLEECEVRSNSAILGGGVLLQDSPVLAVGCRFVQNDAILLGGGVLVFGAEATFTASDFLGNGAGNGAGLGGDGGSATLERCTFLGNAADAEGGAMALSSNAFELSLSHCTLLQNSATAGGCLFVPSNSTSAWTMHGSIARENTLPTFLDNGLGTVSFTNAPGPPPGTGNVDLLPGFRAPDLGDLTLAPGSAMIDRGNPLDPPDPDGTTRDLGAFPFDQRAEPLEDLTCVVVDPCSGAVTATWGIADDYTEIIIRHDGLPIASLAGSAVVFELNGLPPGQHELCVEPHYLTFSGDPRCCLLDIPAPPPPPPVQALACDLNPLDCTTALSWENPEAYEVIEIRVDGLLALTLPGTTTTAIVGIPAEGLTTISVDGVANCSQHPLTPVTCTHDCGLDFARFIRGDANHDGQLDISDPLVLLSHLFVGGSLLCEDAADANDDGLLELTDAIELLGAIFGLVPLPQAPGPGACGPDPTFGDPLTCSFSPACP